jgi:hypothetical protein
MRPRYRTAFKIPLGLSIPHVGQLQSQPFKYFTLNAMGHLGILHSLLAPHSILFTSMLRLIYPFIETPIIHVYISLFVPTASKDAVAMMQSLFFLLCSSSLCVTNCLVWRVYLCSTRVTAIKQTLSVILFFQEPH